MDIHKLEIALKIAEMLEGKCETKETLKEDYAIVVLDRGFVYVGSTTSDNQGNVTMTDAHNIRSWGTTKGLGELVLEGPKSNTKTDKCGTVKIPAKSLISIHPTEKKLWKGL